MCCVTAKIKALVTGDALKIVVTQFDANGFADIAFAFQIVGQLFAQAREKFGLTGFAVAHRVQVALDAA